MENKIVENVEFMEAMETEPVEEATAEKKPKMLTKIGKGVRKHGKKIIAGAVIALVGVVGYAIGKEFGKKAEADYEPPVDDDTVENVEWSETSEDISEEIYN